MKAKPTSTTIRRCQFLIAACESDVRIEKQRDQWNDEKSTHGDEEKQSPRADAPKSGVASDFSVATLHWETVVLESSCGSRMKASWTVSTGSSPLWGHFGLHYLVTGGGFGEL